MSTLIVQKNLIVDNYHIMCGETGVKVIPMLKGNAYGLGDVEIARALYDAGVKMFSVSRLEEAMRLHEALPDVEILLLTPYSTEKAANIITDIDITAAVGSYDSAVLLNGVAAKKDKKCRVHIAFDTGMGRSGFLPQEVEKAIQAAKYLTNLTVCGCFSHFSNCFGKSKKDVALQLEQFLKCTSALKSAGIDPGMCHIANSNASLLYPETRLNAVRTGSALLGRVGVKTKAPLKRVGALQCEICDTHWLPAGHNIGYGNTMKTKKALKIAVIPTGYADGLYVCKAKDTFRFRDVLRYGFQDFKYLFGSGKMYCKIKGKKARILGRIGFCNVVADISNIDCNAGDIAEFSINPMYVNTNVPRAYV